MFQLIIYLDFHVELQNLPFNTMQKLPPEAMSIMLPKFLQNVNSLATFICSISPLIGICAYSALPHPNT